MRKYRLTDETNEEGLHRIEALIDGPWGPAGTKGGWIESEENLAQDGTCWVYDQAQVWGDALVYGDARVYGVARVFGNAQVYGDARVYGKTFLRGESRIAGQAQLGASTDYLLLGPLGSREAMLTVYRIASGIEAATGCFVGTIEEFLAAVEKRHSDTLHGQQYRNTIAYAIAVLDNNRKGDKQC